VLAGRTYRWNAHQRIGERSGNAALEIARDYIEGEKHDNHAI